LPRGCFGLSGRILIWILIGLTVLMVAVGLVRVLNGPDVSEANSDSRDEELLRVTGTLLSRDLAQTVRIFSLGTELFDLSNLSQDERTGVLHMLYKQDEDVSIVVLLDENNRPAAPEVFLTDEQVKTGSESGNRLPVTDADVGSFMKNLPIELAREKGKAFGGVYVDRARNTALLAGAVAVPAGDGRLWVLGFERSLRRIQQLITTTFFSPDQSIFVVDGGGRLVAHPVGSRFLGRELVSDDPAVSKFLGGARSGSSINQASDGRVQREGFNRLEVIDWAVVLQRTTEDSDSSLLPIWFLIIMGVVLIGASLLLDRHYRHIQTRMQEVRTSAERHANELKLIQGSLLESRKLNAIGDLGAGVAHEFNNPLGGILGLTQLLMRKKKQDDPDLQFLQRIEEEAKRCKTITDDLLRFSELQMLENREPLRMDKQLDNTLSLLTRKFENRGIHIERAFSPDLPRICGNEGGIQRMLLNVFLNAETAMHNGGTLTLSTKRDGDEVVVSIADTGNGIAPENIERVFEPFFTTKDNWKGAGIGLWVVYQIVQDHKGHVKIESELGKGTTVIFRFPVDEKGQHDGL
jgi:two-component system NtrC family sensor kinase